MPIPLHHPNPNDAAAARQRRGSGAEINLIITLSAQCFPRHACPLYGSVLMHLHDTQKSPPGLAGLSVNDPQTIMQIHAPYACIASEQQKFKQI